MGQVLFPGTWPYRGRRLVSIPNSRVRFGSGSALQTMKSPQWPVLWHSHWWEWWDWTKRWGECPVNVLKLCGNYSLEVCNLMWPVLCPQAQHGSRTELMRVLKVLDQALEPRTFLVGESISLADMAVATAVLLPFKYVGAPICCLTGCTA